MMTTPTSAPDTPSTAFLNELGFLGGVAVKGCACMRVGAGCVAPVQRNPSQYRRLAGFEGSGYQPGESESSPAHHSRRTGSSVSIV